jgi:hypothetical protein
LKGVWFAGRKDLGPRDQLSLALRHWTRLEQEVVRLGSGPWALNLVHNGLVEVRLREP